MNTAHSTAAESVDEMIAVRSRSTLVRVGGGLSLAGCLAGLGILTLCCGGLDAALPFSVLPTLAGLVGGAITFFASTGARQPGTPDTSVLAALFIAAMAVLGGLLEMAAWLHWPILFNQHA